MAKTSHPLDHNQPIQHTSISQLLKAWADKTPNNTAIAAPGRASLTYNRLSEHVADVVRTLNARGIGTHGRVAIVLPNGPELATAFIAVAAGASAAPLNPSYRAGEYEFYLSDLNASALIIQAGMESPAVAVAEANGIPVIDLHPQPDGPAGIFTLGGDDGSAAHATFAQPDDVALALHTSGTTSRPKIVPLTQANICTSAHNIAAWLQLSEDDRCLNVMPLFHVHGLIGALLSSLMAGASAVCTPGFFATDFFDWMEECHPSWYTAVPTMHQSVLMRAEAHQGLIARHPLRFIRSCSASLAPQIMAELEETFDAPVVEAYGMTEAAHQMTCNPLPPLVRKPGSVGLPTGPEVAIMDEAGNLLPQGVTGEIVIRGPNVTRGYENNPEANQSAFTEGWFRTGDEGHLDDEGYLTITGRIKEIINRGGEKISPREVDEVLMTHPAVLQAVAFAAPHPQLGEEVAAAIVLRENVHVTEEELRRHAAARLAAFKVPTQVVFVDAIPKGPTGKLQRVGLADTLGIIASSMAAEGAAEFVAPRTPAEETLAQIWASVLGLERVGVCHSFLSLGGDSMLAARVVAQVSETFQVVVTLEDFFEASTVESMALIIEEKLLEEMEALTDDEAQRLLDED